MDKNKSKNLVRFQDVVKWLKSNADDNYYIGYNVNGKPYIDVKLLCKDIKKDLITKKQKYDKQGYQI